MKMIKLAEYHLFLHRCYFLLDKAGTPYASKVRSILRLNKLYTQERYTQCDRLFKELNYSCLPYAVFKGVPLSIAAYNHFCYRVSSDIDLLVDRKHIKHIDLILRRHGFIQGKIINGEIQISSREEKIFHLSQSHQTVPYIRMQNNSFCKYINIDINTDIFWGESNNKVDMESFLNNRVLCEMLNTQVYVLPIEKLFIGLCLHHYKDMNSFYLLHNREGFSLSLLCDLYFLYKNNIRLEIVRNSEVYEEVKKYIYFCLSHAIRIFGTERDQDDIRTIFEPEYTYDIWKYGLDEKKRYTWKEDWLNLILDNRMREYLNQSLSDSDLKLMAINEKYM
jgi:hypothetical protein